MSLHVGSFQACMQAVMHSVAQNFHIGASAQIFDVTAQFAAMGVLLAAILVSSSLLYEALQWGLLALQHTRSGEMWVAAGTIFLDVLVWRRSELDSSAKPLYRLKGHEGSIHRSAPLQPLLM